MTTASHKLKVLFAAVFIFSGVLVHAADERQDGGEFKVSSPKTYTSGDQVDYTAEPSVDAKKGATVLLWKKAMAMPMAEVEISPLGLETKRSFFVETHFFHTMVFFDRLYTWRVRFVDANKKPLSAYSEPVEFRVLRSGVRGDEMPQAREGDAATEVVVVQDGDSGEDVRVLTPQNKSVQAVSSVSRQDGVTNAAGRGLASVSRVQIPAPAPTVDRAQEKKVLQELFVDESDGSDEADFNY